jgi:PAS domain S-box-containing protein
MLSLFLQTCRRSFGSLRGQFDSARLRSLLNLLAFELTFLVFYAYSMSITARSGAPIWLPDAVLLCALLLVPPRSWLLYLAATLPLRLVVAVPSGTPVWFLLAAFANDSLKALLAAALLRRLFRGRAIRFDSLYDFWIYLLAAGLVVPAISATVGGASWMARGREFWSVWRSWYFGDALANIVVTPLLLCLARDWRKLFNARRTTYLQAAALFSGLLFAVEFANQRGLNDLSVLDVFDYLPVPLLLVAAVRFGPLGASVSMTMVGILSIAATASGKSGTPVSDASVLSMQLFMMVIGIPVMSLAVLMEQQSKTRQSLRESEARFRNMADTAPVMIWISCPDKRAAFFNRGWLEFTGRTLEQEQGFGWLAGVDSEHREGCLAGYSSAFENRQPWLTECQLHGADGQFRWVLFRGAARFSDDGSFDGYIVSASDITDLKSAQETSLARQKLESLGVLAEGIAHDFNNLLGSIHVNAELAEASMADGSLPYEELQIIKSISMRASGIVRQMMIYGGSRESDSELVDLSQVVAEMLDLIHVSISKTADLKTCLEANLPATLGNRSQIQQVVMNLILNASDALSGNDGVISVKTSLGATSNLRALSGAAGLREGNYVCLEVSDTGSGISRETQARIFDPFFSTKFAGRGLGLAVVQGIVRGHDGFIELTSAPGRGTAFRILFPTAHEAPDRSADAPAMPRSESGPETSITGNVLVVEDEHPLREAITKALCKEGFSVVDVADGTAAVAMFNDPLQKIDLILLDVTIPGTPGSAVVTEAGRLRPQAKLLLMSAYSREKVGPMVDGGQVMGFIRKPFPLRDLVVATREALFVPRSK